MADEPVTTMDYPEHERSYETFMAMTKMGIVACLNILLVLLMTAFISGGLAIFFVILTIAAVGISFFAKFTWVPSGVVFVIAALICLFSLAG